MIDYIIMEYNIETKRYITIGVSEGVDSKQAKELYVKRNGWKQKPCTMLFAKPPICR